MNKKKDFYVGSIGFNALSIPKLFDLLIEKNLKGYITVSGVSGVIESKNSDIANKAHNESLFTVPDGMPIVWIGKRRGFDLQRCYGPELMEFFLKKSVNKPYKHFLYGGKPGMVDEIKEKVKRSFGDVNFVGSYTPPFRKLNSKEETLLINVVNQTKPDFFWVGIGCPKQEIFMNEMINKLDVKYMLGVGYAFDLLSGRAKKTPKFIQKIGMEWFFRLIKDPTRLWKRYFYIVPAFIFGNFKDIIKK
tara:strand:- start:11484 stop:12224 length:741 start_codon:yes stop_codon:yes gene_type:complete